MQVWKDSENRKVELSITVGICKRVRDVTKMDLTDVNSKVDVGGEKLPIVAVMQGAGGLDGISLMVDALYLCCESSLRALGVDDVQFAACLTGAGLQAAQDAFNEEWISFFQGLNRADSIRVIQATGNLSKKLVAKALAMLETAEERGMQFVEDRVSRSATTSADS